LERVAATITDIRGARFAARCEGAGDATFVEQADSGDPGGTALIGDVVGMVKVLSAGVVVLIAGAAATGYLVALATARRLFLCSRTFFDVATWR